jgi:hypothetical protein
MQRHDGRNEASHRAAGRIRRRSTPIRRGRTAQSADYRALDDSVPDDSARRTPDLLLQDTVLFPKIIDDRVLLTRDPSGHRGHENLPWLNHRRHPVIVARPGTDRQLSA